MNANLSFEEWLRTRNYPAGMAEQYRETLEILWRSETGQWFSTAPPATSAPVTAIERSAGLPEMSAPAAFAEPVSAGPREGNLPTGEARKSTRQRRKKASMARPSTNGASLQTNVCPVMPVWVSDWLASGSIQAQDPLEEGAFFHLLCLEWQQPDLGLPDNDNELAILSRLGPRWFKKPHPKATMTCGERIRKSFLQKGGRLYNNRLLRERQKQVEHREKMAEAGLRGAAKRWGGDGLAKGQNMARPFSKHGLVS